MKKLVAGAAVIALGLSVAACGTNPTDRALTGAAIGAATGGIGAAVVGGRWVAGAVVGSAVGAAAGVLTDDRDVNLGKPVYK